MEQYLRQGLISGSKVLDIKHAEVHSSPLPSLDHC